MEADRERVLFYTGTGLFLIALFELTIYPFLLYKYFPILYIPALKHKIIIGAIYFLALISYMGSVKYFIKQIGIIASCFAFYVLFQYFVSCIQ